MNILISAVVIVGLLFGGGATIAAAQNDLPNEPLYQLKLMSEDASLWFVSSPVQKINRLMQQAQTRIQEMEALASQGVTPPGQLTVQAQQHIQQALKIAAQLNEQDRTAALQGIQTRLQAQLQQMEQSQNNDCTECDQLLQQTREMLQLQLRAAENELEKTGQMQNQNQQQNQNQLRVTQTPASTDSTTSPCGTCTPALDGTGQQNGAGPAAATPMQQNNQNNPGGSGNPTGTGSGGGNNPSPGDGGKGGKP